MNNGTIPGTVGFKSFSDDDSLKISSVKEKALLVKFDAYKHPFVIIESCCGNPECECNEISLQLIEVDDSGATLGNPLHFQFFLNLKNWQENRAPQRSQLSQRLVDEFLANLTVEMKTRFKMNYDFVKQGGRNAARFIKSIKKIKRGQMFAHTDVFDDRKSVLSGGNGVSFSFVYKEKNYLIEDLYCVDPECDCKSARLVFLEYDEKRQALTNVFDCRFHFKNGLEIEDHPGCTKKKALKIFNEWRKDDPYLVIELERRYHEMKEFGRNLIIKDSSPKPNKFNFDNRQKEKIGRNMPCPCGSGKKYKKCCGK